MYDRLAIPVPTDDDRDRWEEKRWDPDDRRFCSTFLRDVAPVGTRAFELVVTRFRAKPSEVGPTATT
jgi:hypothetical protein